MERIPDPLFREFLTVLSDLRGDFLRSVSDLISKRIEDIVFRRDLVWEYMFEKIDCHELMGQTPDSATFIEYCAIV